MHTSRLTAVAGCVVTLAALLGSAAPTGAAPPREADVRVTINDSGTAGRVISSRPACERGVGVSVVTLNSGAPSLLAFDETDLDGRWNLREARGTEAKVFALVPGDTAACAPAQSTKVSIPLRAAGPANVRVSPRLPAMDAPRGRVVSPREGCEQGAGIALFYRPDPSSAWRLDGSRTTDDQGRYEFGSFRSRLLGETNAELRAVALASRGCEIAQSTIEPIPNL